MLITYFDVADVLWYREGEEMKESSKYLSLKGRGTNNVLVFDTNRYMGVEEYLSL